MADPKSKLLELANANRAPDWLDKFNASADPKQRDLLRQYVADFHDLRRDGHKIGWLSLAKAINADEDLPAAKDVKPESLKRCVNARPEEFGTQ